MAWESFEPGAENRVIVLSDGDANVEEQAGLTCSLRFNPMQIVGSQCLQWVLVWAITKTLGWNSWLTKEMGTTSTLIQSHKHIVYS